MKRIELLFAGILVIAGCGGGAAPLGLFGPPSPKEIASKPSQSSMRDGHFQVNMTVVSGATKTAGNGDGVMVINPRPAFQINVQVDTGTFIGRVGLDIIEINGKQYRRIGNQDWQVSDDPATSADTRSFNYLGEDQIGNNTAWHIQSHADSWTYDEWIRQSDGYLVKYAGAASDGTTLTLTFDKYNTGARVQPPPPPDPKKVAAKAYQDLVDPLNMSLTSISAGASLHQSTQDLAGYRSDMANLAKLESQYVDGVKTIQFPPGLQSDVQAVTDSEAMYIQLTQQRSQAANWAAINGTNTSWMTASKTRTEAINRLRADLGLPPAL